MSALVVTERAGAMRFAVHVQPRAARTELAGVHDGALKVRVNAPPVDGAANDAVIAMLATLLGVRRRVVRIISGVTSRTKIIEVNGVERARILRLVNPPETPTRIATRTRV